MTKKFTGVAVVLAMLGTICGCAADASVIPGFGNTVSVTSETETTGDTATISFGNLPGGNTSLSVYTAPALISGTYGAFNTIFTALLGYCTDLYDYASAKAKYTVGTLTSSHQSTGTNDLSQKQINEITTLIAANNKDQAGTQLAIWSVEYGNAFSFSNASGSTGADAAAYLAALNGSTPADVALYQLQSPGVQGMAFAVNTTSAARPSPIGEPASIAIAGTGLLGWGLVRLRRRKRRTSIAPKA